jgi:tuberous sclerosis protein 2
MRELLEIVGSKRLEEYAVQAIWRAVQDLLDRSQPADVRQAVLQFTQCLVQGQYSELGVMRAHFFRVIQSHQVEEDSQQRLELLIALTLGGKDIQYFEEEIGPFLAEWIPQLAAHVSVEQLLGLLVKLVHYNSAYLEDDVLSQLVSHTCSLATNPSSPSETELCLSFLDAVICYAVFPPQTILSCIVTLCHTLNIERFIQKSLEVMQRLLGTHLGHTVVYTMCSVLQDKVHGADVLLLRGAVFFISMSLWGVKKVDTLSLPFTAVLPAIHQASLSGHTLVIYEVTLSVLRLVRHYSSRLGPREWEMIFHILHATQRHLSQQAEPSSAAQLQSTLQDIFSSVEQFWEDGENSIGPAHLFFQLLDEVRATLPVTSVLSLLRYQSQTIDAAELDWLAQISLFMDKFFRSETRLVVRREALGFLDRVLADHWLTQQDLLLQQVLLPVFTPLSMDTDPDLRCQAVQLLIKFLPSSSPTHTSSLLDIVSQVYLFFLIHLFLCF